MPEACAHWRGKPQARLRKSLALSAVAVMALIGLLDFPGTPRPGPEITLQLLPKTAATVEEDVVEEAADEPAPAAESVRVTEVAPQVPEASPGAADSEPGSIDWYQQFEAAVASTLDAAARPVSVNPGLDRRRRAAAVQFAPSRAPRPVPIWENVEIDQLGRKILVSGDCYRVIDDPSAVNYEVFRTFHQYLVQCASYRRPAQELPWVEELRDRYDYLAREDRDRQAPRTQLSARLY